MPSQPDYTVAYQLSPQLKPRELADELSDEKAKNALLIAELAQLRGVAPEDVVKDVEQATLPAEEAPLPAPEVSAEVAPVEVTAEGALFFASKEGKKYYPIEKLEEVGIKAENLVYFKTEQEAIAASYTA